MLCRHRTTSLVSTQGFYSRVEPRDLSMRDIGIQLIFGLYFHSFLAFSKKSGKTLTEKNISCTVVFKKFGLFHNLFVEILTFLNFFLGKFLIGKVLIGKF